jgi:hypothetical protein
MEQKLDELLYQLHHYLFADAEQIISELRHFILDHSLKEAELGKSPALTPLQHLSAVRFSTLLKAYWYFCGKTLKTTSESYPPSKNESTSSSSSS